MDDPFVTLAQVADAEEAKRLRLRLEAAGLRAIVQEPNTVRVVAEDLIESQVIVKDWQTEKVQHDTAPEDDDEVDRQEMLAAKAFRCAVFGFATLVLFPLLFYSVYLLFTVWQMPGPLSKTTRGYVWKTLAVILLPFVLVLLLFVTAPFFTNPDADMAEVPRPAVLVGFWVSDEVDKSRVLLDLFEDGHMRYRVDGPVLVDYKGLWGYADHNLVLRFRERLQGPLSLVGRTTWIRNERMKGDEILLRMASDDKEPLRFLRK